MLAVGIKAPDFSLPDQNGELHKLSEYRRKKVILYFYPKDMTAGNSYISSNRSEDNSKKNCQSFA